MYKKIKSETGKRLLSNFFSLSSIQIVSYILPMITIPYLVRTLGAEKFGLIAFAQAIIQYFVIFSDYGFGLSATKEIAENRENLKKIEDIFSSVMVIKLIFIILSFILLSILVFSVDQFKSEWELYYLTFGIVVGQALFPVWFFQGIEKMQIVALINILPKFFFTLSIFVFIRQENDYIYVPLINSLGFLFAGIVSLWLAFFKFNAHFSIPTKRQIAYQIKEGWHIFLGIISSNMIMLNVTFLLGILTNATIVGYYSAVEKIIRPISSLNRPVINAIFPYLANTAKTNKNKSIDISKKITLYISAIMLILGLIMFVYSDDLIELLYGKDFTTSSMILKFMAFIPFIKAIIDIYAVPNMILLNLKNHYSNILFVGLFFSLIFAFILIKFYSAKGAAIIGIVTDIFILLGMGFYINRYMKYGEA